MSKTLKEEVLELVHDLNHAITIDNYDRADKIMQAIELLVKVKGKFDED